MSTIQDCFLYSETDFTQVKDAISPKSFLKDDMIIAVMGTTGAGKTTFISSLTGKEMDVGNNLMSHTTDITPIFCEHPTFPGRRIVFLDTPGFDNTYRSQLDIFERIALWLAITYSEGVKLSGILYLERISGNTLSEDSIKNFKLFRDLCGSQSLPNAILVTTMWSEVPETVGARRESGLIAKWWKPMVMDGAQVARFHKASDSGWNIVSMLKDKAPIVLQIQDEIVNQKKTLLDTKAGRGVEEALKGTSEGCNDELGKTDDQLSEEIERLRTEREKLEQSLRGAKEALQLKRPKGTFQLKMSKGWLPWVN